MIVILSTYSIAESKSLTKNNTIYLKTNDSSYVTIVKYPSQTWLRRNEGYIVGSLLGALFAGIIAIISVKLTSQQNIKSRIQREKEIYCGLLYSIKVELIYHDKNHQFLADELKVIQQNSLAANEIITDSPGRNISINFLKELRSKIIDTELFETQILLFLTAYINKCELINNDINFERLIRVNEKFKENLNFSESIKGYFDVIISEIENLKKSIPGIIKLINNDLVKMGKTSDIDESEYLKISS